MYQNLHRRLFSEENMFMFYFQPDYARIKRDDWLECFEQCQAAAIFENQILPSEGRTDICWEMQKCEYLDGYWEGYWEPPGRPVVKRPIGLPYITWPKMNYWEQQTKFLTQNWSRWYFVTEWDICFRYNIHIRRLSDAIITWTCWWSKQSVISHSALLCTIRSVLWYDKSKSMSWYDFRSRSNNVICNVKSISWNALFNQTVTMILPQHAPSVTNTTFVLWKMSSSHGQIEVSHAPQRAGGEQH